uniref:Uncharacterized protein n=1 Tax=Knipowitschia caucasica TaxID=637954 RepID=A0AAV2KPR0_KNICA
MAILCSAGRLSPARLERGGRGAAQAEVADNDTGPRTRAEGEGAQVEETVEMRDAPAEEGGAGQDTDSTEEMDS